MGHREYIAYIPDRHGKEPEGSKHKILLRNMTEQCAIGHCHAILGWNFKLFKLVAAEQDGLPIIQRCEVPHR